MTTRLAKMPWGAIFKIEFTDIKSRAEKQREIRPDYFIVTDDRIVLLNEEDNDAAAKKISTLDKPPEFEPNNIYGITSGSFEHQEGEWKTTIKLKGDLCIYEASHPSGHFKKIVWKKGVGLVEYASGYGAHADGYRLKREVTGQKRVRFRGEFSEGLNKFMEFLLQLPPPISFFIVSAVTTFFTLAGLYLVRRRYSADVLKGEP